MLGCALGPWLTGVLGSSDFHTIPLTGGASDRWYARVTGAPVERLSGVRSAVVMGVPPHLSRVIQHFVSIRVLLEQHDVPVPTCYVPPGREGLALLEDLGDVTLRDRATAAAARKPLYESAVRLLATLHEVPPDYCRCPAMKLHFDRSKYDFEFRFHVHRWVVGHYFSATPTPAERQALDEVFGWIGAELARSPRVFTHRDFQSTNLMVSDSDALSLIDFQDARQGTRAYDLASLLYDSYVDLEEGERLRFEQAYLDCLPSRGRPERETFHRLLVVAALQRKLHDAGAFVYTAHARGKTAYLDWVPGTLDMVQDLSLIHI